MVATEDLSEVKGKSKKSPKSFLLALSSPINVCTERIDSLYFHLMTKFLCSPMANLEPPFQQLPIIRPRNWVPLFFKIFSYFIKKKVDLAKEEKKNPRKLFLLLRLFVTYTFLENVLFVFFFKIQQNETFVAI